MRDYVLITPCRDEVKYARTTLDSVIKQSCLPALWIIVDDGSTDGTSEILEEYKDKYSFIEIAKKEDRGRRLVGPGVVDAFYFGYNLIDTSKYEYICKLDLDLDLPPNYFESLIERMEENPRIGTCSGKPYFINPGTGSLKSEKCGDENSVGMTKFFRMECFLEIGGFVREVMWDGIDCHRCRMLGWIAASWDSPEIRFIHLRPMGSSHRSIIIGRVRWGYGQYFMGTGPAWILVSGVYRMFTRPFIVGGICIIVGYLSSWIKKKQRYPDFEFRKFLRKYHFLCLVFGKKNTIKMLDKKQEMVWRSRWVV